jgi:hypothetical protein
VREDVYGQGAGGLCSSVWRKIEICKRLTQHIKEDAAITGAIDGTLALKDILRNCSVPDAFLAIQIAVGQDGVHFLNLSGLVPLIKTIETFKALLRAISGYTHFWRQFWRGRRVPWTRALHATARQGPRWCVCHSSVVCEIFPAGEVRSLSSDW